MSLCITPMLLYFVPRLDYLIPKSGDQQVMPDDHGRLVPLLPIPNRTVKRFCADDSAVTSVKVGYCQAITTKNPRILKESGGFCLF